MILTHQFKMLKNVNNGDLHEWGILLHNLYKKMGERFILL